MKQVPIGKDHEGRTIYAFQHQYGTAIGVYVGDILWIYGDLSFEPYLGVTHERLLKFAGDRHYNPEHGAVSFC